MNYDIWPYDFDRSIDRISVAYVYFMVIKVWNVFFESFLVPARISLRTKEDRRVGYCLSRGPRIVCPRNTSKLRNQSNHSIRLPKLFYS